MADIVDPATRARMMAGIGPRDTHPEMVLRRALHARGLRFRLQAREMPGRPDLLLPRHRVAIFVHGCFWHRHQGCRYTTSPATRPLFWQEKFAANMARDARVSAALLSLGWRVALVWECGLKRDAAVLADALAAWIRDGAPGLAEFPALPPVAAVTV